MPWRRPSLRGSLELVFVTDRTKRAIEYHFDATPELERELREQGRDDLAAAIHEIVPDHVNCIFNRQPRALGLGHAVHCAAPVIGREPFAVVVLADHVVKGNPQPTSELIAAYARKGCTQLSVMEVERSEVSLYGIVAPRDVPHAVAGLVAKPRAEDAPSRLASIGRQVLEPDILDILAQTRPGAGSEIQLADAINRRAGEGRVRSVPLAGARYDRGSKLGYLEAIVDFSLDHGENGDPLAELITRRARGRAA